MQPPPTRPLDADDLAHLRGTLKDPAHLPTLPLRRPLGSAEEAALAALLDEAHLSRSAARRVLQALAKRGLGIVVLDGGPA